MRILFLARKKRRTRTPTHIAHALRELGHEVKLVWYGQWKRRLGERLGDWVLRRRVAALRPGLVLVWKGCISLPLLRTLGETYKTAVVCVDWFAELPPGVRERARLADLFLVTNTGQLEAFRKLGIRRPVFWPQAFDEETYASDAAVSPDLVSEVAFIGNPEPAHRQQLLERIDRTFELKIWGRGWDVVADKFRGIQGRQILPQEYGAVCRAAKVIVGRDAARDVELCFSNRLWLTLGCGGFLVTNYVPGFETLFENHKHLVWYRSPEECVELIGDYLGRPEDRARIAQAGCELVRQKHTYVHRARELVTLVEDLPEKTGPA